MNTTCRNILLFVGAAGLAFDSACYEYVPSTSATLPGADVRLELTGEGTTEMARLLGPRVVSVDGKVSSIAPDGSLVVAPVAVQSAEGARQSWTGEDTVSFARRFLSGVQLRTLDRRRSTIAALGIVGAIAAAGAIAMHGGGSSESPSTGGPGTGVFGRLPRP